MKVEERTQVAVIIPTYKPQQYLFKCLDSLKSQQRSVDFFVIIILNGERLPYFEKISTYLNENLTDCSSLLFTSAKGVSNARNIGIDYAQSKGFKYLMFIDDDDFLSVNYLSSLVRSIKSDSGIVVSNVVSFEERSSLQKVDYLGEAFGRLKSDTAIDYSQFRYRSFFSSACAKLIPSRVIGNIRFHQNIHNGEDALFMFNIAKNVKCVYFSPPGCIYYRRMRLTSASRKQRPVILRIFNVVQLFYLYSVSYVNGRGGLEFTFYISRILATFKVFLKSFFR